MAQVHREGATGVQGKEGPRSAGASRARYQILPGPPRMRMKQSHDKAMEIAEQRHRAWPDGLGYTLCY